MNWIQVNELPIVVSILSEAQLAIKKATGVDVSVGIIDSHHYRVSRMDELKPFVQKVICEFFKTNWQLIEEKSREQKFVDARFAYSYIMVEIYKQSKKATGRDIKKHHTSVMHAIKEVKGYMKVDEDYRIRINQLIKMLPQ